MMSSIEKTPFQLSFKGTFQKIHPRYDDTKDISFDELRQVAS